MIRARPRRTTRSLCLRRRLVCMRETPSYGTRCIRRTSNLTSSHSTTWEQRDVVVSTCEGNLGATEQVQAPSGAHRALNLEEGEADLRTQKRGGDGQHGVAALVAGGAYTTGAGRTEVCQFWGLLRMRLLSVSRIFLKCGKGRGVSIGRNAGDGSGQERGSSAGTTCSGRRTRLRMAKGGGQV